MNRTDTYYQVAIQKPGETDMIWLSPRHRRRLDATNQAKSSLINSWAGTVAMIFLRTHDAYIFTAVNRYRVTENGVERWPFEKHGTVLTYVSSTAKDWWSHWDLTDGEGRFVGSAYVVSAWSVPKTSYIGTRMYHVRATLIGKEHEGKKFWGRTFGPGMALVLHPAKSSK